MNIETFGEHTPQLAPSSWIHARGLVIGQVRLGEHSSVWPGAIVRGDMHHIHIGERCSIQDNAVVHVTHDSPFNPGGYPVTVGDDVTIGHHAMIHGCTIGNRVMVGMQAMLMDGVTVEDDVIIGAGAMVTQGKTLTSGYLYVGTPAKAVRKLTAEELEFLPYVAGNYVRLKDSYLKNAK